LKFLVCYRRLGWELLFSFVLEVTVGVGCYYCLSDRSGASLYYRMVINVGDFSLVCGGWL
jgi:hypothetical protein